MVTAKGLMKVPYPKMWADNPTKGSKASLGHQWEPTATSEPKPSRRSRGRPPSDMLPGAAMGRNPRKSKGSSWPRQSHLQRSASRTQGAQKCREAVDKQQRKRSIRGLLDIAFWLSLGICEWTHQRPFVNVLTVPMETTSPKVLLSGHHYLPTTCIFEHIPVCTFTGYEPVGSRATALRAIESQQNHTPSKSMRRNI